MGAQIAAAQNEPVWSQVATAQFFGYHADQNQIYNYLSNNIYLPRQFGAGDPPLSDALGCVNNQAPWVGGTPPPYWYDNGVKMSGSRQITLPAVGMVFTTPLCCGQQTTRGLAFRANWHSAVSAAGAWGGVYYSNNFCYMGTLEYGFQRDYSFASPGYVGFYYSRYANCPSSGSVSCRKTDSANGELAQGCSGGINLPSDIDLNSQNKWYEAYVFWDNAAQKYKFKVQVVDATTYNYDYQCVVDPSAADPFSGDSRCHRNGNYSQTTCGTDFPVSSLNYAYGSVTETVNSNNSAFAAGTSALEVYDIRVGK